MPWSKCGFNSRRVVHPSIQGVRQLVRHRRSERRSRWFESTHPDHLLRLCGPTAKTPGPQPGDRGSTPRRVANHPARPAWCRRPLRTGAGSVRLARWAPTHKPRWCSGEHAVLRSPWRRFESSSRYQQPTVHRRAIERSPSVQGGQGAWLRESKRCERVRRVEVSGCAPEEAGASPVVRPNNTTGRCDRTPMASRAHARTGRDETRSATPSLIAVEG